MLSVEISKRGIAIVLTRPDGKIAMLTEENDSYETHKMAGDTSVPMESTDPGESPECVIGRLNGEEIDIAPLEIVARLSSIYVRPWVLVDIYYCRTLQNAELKDGRDTDIYHARWEDKSLAVDFPIGKPGLRPATREAILDAIAFEQFRIWPRVHLATIDRVPDQYYLDRGFQVRRDAQNELQYLQSVPVLP